ncbi:DNA-methyltransferase [Bacillus sp. T33-2]|uniref:DNA-methyltransferase n=1 Tax=Bacillus sp. T33-2 TaxID=2054168 RepID=UPI0015E10F67|nr:site-specific DNA-methyltransferase [Bacillus sp. T33-2]
MNILNRIINDDCIKGLQAVYEEYGECIDLCITDPPYGIDYQSNWGREGSKLKKIVNDGDLTWFQDFSDVCFNVLKNNSAFYCFTRFDVYPQMYNCLIKSGFKVKNLLIVQKGQKGGNGDLQAQYSNDCEMLIYANKGRRKFNKTKLAKTDGRKGAAEFRTRLPNVWFDTEYNTYPKSTVNVSNQKDAIIHPTEKNVEMIKWFLEISSNQNDVILDPFMGSGTTAIACINTQRNYIGFELEQEYHKLSEDRIHNLVLK